MSRFSPTQDSRYLTLMWMHLHQKKDLENEVTIVGEEQEVTPTTNLESEPLNEPTNVGNEVMAAEKHSTRQPILRSFKANQQLSTGISTQKTQDTRTSTQRSTCGNK